jgi:hypothetical protein
VSELNPTAVTSHTLLLRAQFEEVEIEQRDDRWYLAFNGEREPQMWFYEPRLRVWDILNWLSRLSAATTDPAL